MEVFLLFYSCVIRQKFRQTFLLDYWRSIMPLEQKDVFQIAMNVVKHGQNTAFVAEKFKISRRRVQQITAYYRKTGKVPILQQRGRKPYAKYPPNIEEMVNRTTKKLHCGSTVVGKYLRKKRGIKIGNNAICEIMKDQGSSRQDPRKRVKKKPWIRYERKHPLSAVHVDWHENVKKEKVCAITDDCSRMLFAIGEFSRISTDTSITLMQQVMQEYSHIRQINQVISDHGSEFYANKRNKHGKADHRFERFCIDNGIRQVLCRVKHPQSNGKIEKFFDIYDQRRWEFESLEEFTYWYNHIRPHMSLDFDNLETPYQAFNHRLQDVFVGNYMEMIKRDGFKNRGEDIKVIS